jgi:purine-binding chemotaxis protein CheW
MSGAGEGASAGPYLVFALADSSDSTGDRYALDVSSVLQVIEPESVTPVPLAPDVVLGIINHHGRIVTVVDSGKLLDIGGRAAPGGQVVILRQSLRGQPNLGLQVSRSHGIVSSAELPMAEVAAGPGIAWVAQAGRRLVHIVELAPLLTRLGRLFGTPDATEPVQGVTG